MKTSLTDYSSYSFFCYQASRDENLFKNFRQNKTYKYVLEHVSKDMGRKYLDVISRDALIDCEAVKKLCQSNDGVGGEYYRTV